MKVMSVFGIRPDWIKGCSVLKALDGSDMEHVMVHTGQHYSYSLDRIFFEELGLRDPDYRLEVGSGTQGEQTARIVERSEQVMMKERPDIVLVLGDSNSALAAISAAKLNVGVAHIEAGMRAYDWRMPEEKNKRIVDHISSYLFAYTHYQRENLLLEGVPSYKIHVTGNPSVDTIDEFRLRAQENKVLDHLNLSHKDYFLVTSHRAENVDAIESLSKILRGLKLVYEKHGKVVVWPLYPRTQKRLVQFGLSVPDGVKVIEPQGFLEFLRLEMDALCLITDSGTVQEEGCILKVPCVVIRVSTERPETVVLGSSVVAGIEPEDILECVDRMVHLEPRWEHPYGSGVSEKILNILRSYKKRTLIEEMEGEVVDRRREICFSPYLRRR